MGESSVPSIGRPVIRGTQHCPLCGLPPERTDIRENRGVGLGTFLCAGSHLWWIKWVVAA